MKAKRVQIKKFLAEYHTSGLYMKLAVNYTSPNLHYLRDALFGDYFAQILDILERGWNGKGY